MSCEPPGRSGWRSRASVRYAASIASRFDSSEIPSTSHQGFVPGAGSAWNSAHRGAHQREGPVPELDAACLDDVVDRLEVGGWSRVAVDWDAALLAVPFEPHRVPGSAGFSCPSGTFDESTMSATGLPLSEPNRRRLSRTFARAAASVFFELALLPARRARDEVGPLERIGLYHAALPLVAAVA